MICELWTNIFGTLVAILHMPKRCTKANHCSAYHFLFSSALPAKIEGITDRKSLLNLLMTSKTVVNDKSKNCCAVYRKIQFGILHAKRHRGGVVGVSMLGRCERAALLRNAKMFCGQAPPCVAHRVLTSTTAQYCTIYRLWAT